MNPMRQARHWLALALERAKRRGWRGQVKRIHAAQDDLRQPHRITWPGVAAARDQSRVGGLPGNPQAPTPDTGWCLMMVRLCYGIAPSARTAAEAWSRAKDRHPTSSPSRIPRGYPVFWLGGSTGAGHVAVAAGDGFCWSTDIHREGRFDRVPITEIHDRWGLQLVGWAEDLNGTRVEAHD